MAQPVIPSFPDIQDKESLARIEQYLVKLQRDLRYQFAHIDESNIEDGCITEKKLAAPVLRKVEDAYGNVSTFRQTAYQITSRVESAEGNISDIEQTAANIALAVSNDKVYRSTSESALLTQLAGLTPPVDMAVGLLWLDMSNKLLKRCSVVSPLTWENVQADEVHTSVIDIADDSIDIASTGEINIAAGGKLNLSSADGIYIGTASLRISNTNYVTGASAYYTDLIYTADEYVMASPWCNAAGLGLSPGQEVTVSAYIKCPAGVPGSGAAIGWAAFDADDVFIMYDFGSPIAASSEGVSSDTFTIPTGTSYILFSVGTVPSANFTGTIQYKLLKLERGNTVTAWSEMDGELHNSYIIIEDDNLSIVSGGSMSLSSESAINFNGRLQLVSGADSCSYINHIATANDGTWLYLNSTHSPIAIYALNGAYLIVGDPVFSPTPTTSINGDLWVLNNCSAGSFTDRTPSYTGDALGELSKVKNDKQGNIDHSTLPKAAQRKTKRLKKDADNKPIPGTEYEEDGRDLGMMISILTKAVQQLTDRIEKLEAK